MDKFNFNKKIIGAVVAIALILGLGFFWWQQKGSSEEDVQVDSSEIETDLNTDFLDSDRVKNLKRYADFPIEIPEKGRDNPFNPY